jgi:hypothetical protein
MLAARPAITRWRTKERRVIIISFLHSVRALKMNVFGTARRPSKGGSSAPDHTTLHFLFLASLISFSLT